MWIKKMFNHYAKVTNFFIDFKTLGKYVDKNCYGFSYENTDLPQTGEFDTYSETISKLRYIFYLLNHINPYSYEGIYNEKSGWLKIEKVKEKKGNLIILIDTSSGEVFFKIKNKYEI